MRNTYNSGRASYSNRGSGYSRNNRKSFKSTWSQRELILSIQNSQAQKDAEPEVTFVAENRFEDFGVNQLLLQNIKNKNYKMPSPIQDQAIPCVMEGKDLIGIANTGTGKTAAFLIPLIDKVYKDRNQKVLIIAPTRELAEQIESEFRALSAGMRIYSAIIIGGKRMFSQVNALDRNPSFVIGTPGRIKDLMERNFLDISKFSNFVLDEADRMLDIGFINEIKYFISEMPEQRHSLFFSATVSPKVKTIVNAFVKNPVTVTVKTQETAVNVHQDVVRITREEKKIEKLHDLLIQEEFEKVIVFGNTKWLVQNLADELRRRGFKADAIHGDKRQSQRRSVLDNFKNNRINVLLATDVAARGLDIDNVSHVINYELPESYDDYVHRIGRTGRANKKGVALTLVDR